MRTTDSEQFADRTLDTLSGGELKRVFVARAHVSDTIASHGRWAEMPALLLGGVERRCTGYPPGPETVNSNPLDSFLPSPVQMAP